MAQRLAKKVLLIGWDAADWRLINPLMDAGLMPTLNNLVTEGVMGNIATLTPALSPMLWTSIATGKQAYKHGIYGFIEPRPDGQGVQIASSTSRKVKAVWNILSQSGLKSNVLGWYASHPAEPINGACVSNLYGRARGSELTPTKAAPEAFHPSRLADAIGDLAIHPNELTPAHVLPFIPRLAEIPPDKRKPVDRFVEILAHCSSIHAATTWLMQNEPWDFMAVYYDAIDMWGHEFMQYHPPRMDHVDATEFEWYKDVMVGAYRFHDMLLETLLTLAGPDTTVILLSDHGFLSDDLRPRPQPGQHAPPPAWHRSHGILCMKGPGLLRDERVYGASLLDIAPTVLTLFGLPVARDMDGKSLVTAFADPPIIEHVDSWESVDGEAGMHPPTMRNDPIESHEAVRQLAELGYVNLPGGDEGMRINVAVKESKFNQACSLVGANRHATALPLLLEVHTGAPREPRYALALALCYLGLERHDDARNVLLSMKETGGADTDQWQLVYARAQYASGNKAEAVECLNKLEATARPTPGLYTDIAVIHELRKNWRAADRAYRKALELDADYAAAHCGLGVVAIRENRAEEALDHLLRALGLLHFYPRAHFFLGVALAKLGWWDRAIKAFEACVRMYPRMLAAHRYLVALHGKLGHPSEVMFYRAQVKRLLTEVKTAGVELDEEAEQTPPDLTGTAENP